MADQPKRYGDPDGPNLLSDVMKQMGYSDEDFNDEGIFGYYDPTNNRSASYGKSFAQYQALKNRAEPAKAARKKTIEQLMGKGYTLEDMGIYDQNDYGKALYNEYRDQNAQVHAKRQSGEVGDPLHQLNLATVGGGGATGAWAGGTAQKAGSANGPATTAPPATPEPAPAQQSQANVQPAPARPESSYTPMGYGSAPPQYGANGNTGVTGGLIPGKAGADSPLRYRGLFS